MIFYDVGPRHLGESLIVKGVVTQARGMSSTCYERLLYLGREHRSELSYSLKVIVIISDATILLEQAMYPYWICTDNDTHANTC